MPDTINDPLTLTYQSLWEVVVNSNLIKSYVKVGNMITFGEDVKFPLQQSPLDSDLPELILIFDGFEEIGLHANSSSSKLLPKYKFMISTGDLRIKVALGLQFALLRSLVKWAKENTNEVIWGDVNDFKITRVDVTAATTAQSNDEANRGIKGWAALIDIEVEMWLRTSALIEGIE